MQPTGLLSVISIWKNPNPTTSFLKRQGAAAGVFTLVGVAVAALILALVFRFCRRRRSREQRRTMFNEKEMFGSVSGAGVSGRRVGGSGAGAGVRMGSDGTMKSASYGIGAGSGAGEGGPWDGSGVRGHELFATPASLSAGRRPDLDNYMRHHPQDAQGLGLPNAGYYGGGGRGAGVASQSRGGVPRWSLSEFEDYYNPNPETPIQQQQQQQFFASSHLAGAGLASGSGIGADLGPGTGAPVATVGGTTAAEEGFQYRYREGQSQQDLLISQGSAYNRTTSPSPANDLDRSDFDFDFDSLDHEGRVRALEPLTFADGTAAGAGGVYGLGPMVVDHPLYSDVPVYGGAHAVQTTRGSPERRRSNTSADRSQSPTTDAGLKDAKGGETPGALLLAVLPRSLSAHSHNSTSQSHSGANTGTRPRTSSSGNSGDLFRDPSSSGSRPSPSPTPSSTSASPGLAMMGKGFGRRSLTQLQLQPQQQQQVMSQSPVQSLAVPASTYFPPPRTLSVVSTFGLGAVGPAPVVGFSQESHDGQYRHRYPPGAAAGGGRERSTSAATQNSVLSSNLASSSSSSGSRSPSSVYSSLADSHSHSHSRSHSHPHSSHSHTHSRTSSDSQNSQSVYSPVQHQLQLGPAPLSSTLPLQLRPASPQPPQPPLASLPHSFNPNSAPTIPTFNVRHPSPPLALVPQRDSVTYEYAIPDDNVSHMIIDDDSSIMPGIRIRDGALLDPNLASDGRQWDEQAGSSAVSLSDAIDYSRRVT